MNELKLMAVGYILFLLYVGRLPTKAQGHSRCASVVYKVHCNGQLNCWTLIQFNGGSIRSDVVFMSITSSRSCKWGRKRTL